MSEITPENDLAKVEGILTSIFEKAAEAWFLASDTKAEFREEIRENVTAYAEIMDRNDRDFSTKVHKMIEGKFNEYASNSNVRDGEADIRQELALEHAC